MNGKTCFNIRNPDRYPLKNKWFWDQSNSTVGILFAWYATDPGLIPTSHMDP